MRLVVTGGCGFIGTNFVRFVLKERTAEITVVDALTYAGSLRNIKGMRGKIKFVKADIADKKKMAKLLKDADAVVNFAAETHVDKAIKNPEPFVRANVFGVYTLLEAARKADVETFIQVSTDEVYGSRMKGSFKEEDALNPRNPYSATKAAGDYLVLSYVNTYGLPAIITRCANNFGPYQNPEKLIPKAIINAIRNVPVPVYGAGKNIRDWIYVEDHCSGILTAMKRGRKGEVYNIGGENEKTNTETVRLILQILKKPESLIKFVTDRPGHDFRYSLDCAKIKKLGWRKKYEFAGALKKTIEWYKANRDFWN